MVKISNIMWVVLLAALLAGGCVGPKKDDDKEIALEVGRSRTELLAEIERKYEKPEAHYELGKLYHTDGLWTNAEMEFNIALSFDPVHRLAQAALVKTLVAAGKEGRSKFAAQFYISQASSTAKGSLLLGQAFQKEDLDDYALVCYQQALSRVPNSAALHKQIGFFYLGKNDMVRAEEYLKRSIQLDPYQPDVSGELGRMGIIIVVPRKVEKNTKELDKLIEAPQ